MDIVKFHLPKILNLAENFNIDISSALESYVRKLRENNLDVLANLNFPEAAMIVEHCAEIYGRKVDFVHLLAMELSQLVTGQIYADKSGENEAQTADSSQRSAKMPKPTRTPKRSQRSYEELQTEDFQPIEFDIESPKVVKKEKNQKKHCQEAGYARLLALNRTSNHDLHIYEDGQAVSIGTKDQFRINWPLDNSCLLTEHIIDRGTESLWGVCDVGIANMLTPENSDDGIGIAEVPNLSVGVDSDDLHQSTEVPGFQDSCSGTGDAKPTLNDALVAGPCETKSVEKPSAIKNTYKLSVDIMKELRSAPQERNMTLFLFSKLLRKNLSVEGLLPPPSQKGQNADKKNIASHIKYLTKRFKLDLKQPINTRSLIEDQPDFLGFEEEEEEEEDDEEEAAVAFSGVQEDDDLMQPQKPSSSDDVLRSQNDDNMEGNRRENLETDVPLVDDTPRKKTSVDVGEVAQWREFVQSRIGNESNGRTFDVHNYSTDILNSFNKVGQTLQFGELTGGLHRSEVCRYFLASLMLANTSNVELNHIGPNSLKLKLKSRERCIDMENILVPPATAVQPLHQSSKDVAEAGPCRGTQELHRRSHEKRDSKTGDDSLRKRYRKQEPGVGPWRKQEPGVGPWKNKSLKGRRK